MTDSKDNNDHHDADGRVVLSATEARQGLRGTPVLYVLVGGLMLALVAWAGSEFYGKAIDTTPENASQKSVPATEPASENEGIIDDNPVPGEKRETEPTLVDPKATGNQ
jgi:hypothetical protein